MRDSFSNLCAASLVTAAMFTVSAPCQAAEADSAVARSHDARIILLGTGGGPVAQSGRSGISTLLIVNGTSYLVDAGLGTDRQLASAGFDVADLSAIFITHQHLDHTASIPSLIMTDWFAKANQDNPVPLVLYGPPATQLLLEDSLHMLATSERIFRAGIPMLKPDTGMFAAHDIDHDGLVYRDANITVTAAENTHFLNSSEGPAGRDISFSYRFDTPYGAIVFTGDTGKSDAVTALAKGAAVLVSEVRLPYIDASGKMLTVPSHMVEGGADAKAYRVHMEQEHLSPQDVGQMAHDAGVGLVILSHFAGGPDTTVSDDFTTGVASRFSGPVIAGQDLMEYDLFAQPDASAEKAN
ncbi:MBL fold metallo-hydrolase [Martelella alba]|uniref:MBL fold metallo-hydrolase n=1 Tax=Martelella alba TaxID=2590451 RepID=A0A506U5W0_9HYPH|nr:MBL fold metallo-hydrolase [Martelella alba]TPW29743.1 MBL fold metallo-hydrolase [Martelella alba]